MLIHHTDCGMLTFEDADLKHQILDETGIKSPFAMETFSDLDADVRNPLRGSKRAHTFHTKTRFADSSTKPSPANFARSRNRGKPGRSSSKVSEIKSPMIGSVELSGRFAERETDVVSSD